VIFFQGETSLYLIYPTLLQPSTAILGQHWQFSISGRQVYNLSYSCPKSGKSTRRGTGDGVKELYSTAGKTLASAQLNWKLDKNSIQ
jgi:hypothetical protein